MKKKETQVKQQHLNQQGEDYLEKLRKSRASKSKNRINFIDANINHSILRHALEPSQRDLRIKIAQK